MLLAKLLLNLIKKDVRGMIYEGKHELVVTRISDICESERDDVLTVTACALINGALPMRVLSLHTSPISAHICRTR